MAKVDIHPLQTEAREHIYFKKSWIQLMRPMTLTGTISPILAGTALATMESSIDVSALIIVLIAAMLVQVSANMLNDYFDFKNGQDTERWSREQSNELKVWQQPVLHQIPWAALTTISLAVILGVWIATRFGWWIAGIGTVGIIVAFVYSAGTKSLSSLGLGELTGAIFLGFVPFLLGYVVQGSTLSVHLFLPALPFALLIASMILTNNIRDIFKDEGFRKTLAMRMGRGIAVSILYSLVIGAYVTIIILLGLKIFYWPVGIVIFALLMAARLLRSVRKGASLVERNLGMKWAAMHHWIFGLLYVAGIFIGKFI